MTGDHQWIHVDVERAKETPFGGTIAHGYYTLSLAPTFSEEILKLRGLRVRRQLRPQQGALPRAAAVGGKVRMSATLAGVEHIQGGAQVTLALTFENEGGEKPVCVAETLARFYEGLKQPRQLGHVGEDPRAVEALAGVVPA